MKQYQIAMLFFIMLSINCFAQRGKNATAVVSRYNPRFSYEPENRENVASAGITVALLKPVFIDRDISSAGTPWNDFSTSMQNDIEGLLTAKGYKVLGPFNSRDEMVYGDKQKSDFTLLISFDLRLYVERITKTIFSLVGANNIKVVKGDVTLSPTVQLTAISNFTGEKLWKKNLQLTGKNFSYVGTVKWDGIPPLMRELAEENNLYNPLAKNLEDMYKEGLNVMWKQFDLEEMKMIAIEAKKERSTNPKKKDK